MAKFQSQIPTDLISYFENLDDSLDDIFGEMTMAGAKVVYKNIISNMNKIFRKRFKNNESLQNTK